jgi:hypothetical protein
MFLHDFHRYPNSIFMLLSRTTYIDICCSCSCTSMGFVVCLCFYRNDITVLTFEPRCLARVNSLYRVRNGNITQIVKGNPQWPQSFYPVSPAVDVKDGDYIVGQCVYDNNDDRPIQVGWARCCLFHLYHSLTCNIWFRATHHNEMCNVYSMYSFEPSAYEKNVVVPPISMCWENQEQSMAR